MVEQIYRMKYIALKTVKELDASLEFPLSAEQVETVRIQLQSTGDWHQLDELSKAYFLESIQQEKKVLFATWTEGNQALFEVLQTGRIQTVFNDRSALAAHQLFEEYQAFIRPYLVPILVKECEQLDFKKAQLVMSFTVLLGKNDQDKIQEHLALFFGQYQEQLQKSIQNASNDQQLFELLKAQLTKEFWQTINLFNERYYRIRTTCLEELLALAYHKKSSRRLMLFVTSELKQLHLTNEHQKELQQVELDLKSGKHVFESTKIPWKRLIGLSVAALVIVLLGVGVWFIPNHPEDDQLQEKTSFMSFSPAERKEIDSLIETAKQEQLKAQEATNEDQFLPEAPAQLVLRKNWENNIFNKLYRSWSLNDSIASSMSMVAAKKESRAFPGTKHLRSKKGSKQVEFHNSTNLNALIVVFKNKANQPVYTAYVGEKSLYEFTIDEGDFLLVLPGGKIPKNLKMDGLPFKEVDERFFSKLSDIFRVRDFGPKSFSLIWESISTREMYLVDLSLGLEEY